MILKNLEPQNFSELQSTINSINDLSERSANLIWFYMNARFRISRNDFRQHFYCDGANDGGIDSFYQETNNFYILQSKYHETPKTEDENVILHEINKIEKTIIGQNTNELAELFIQSIRNNLQNEKAHLEIKWLTTNHVNNSSKEICFERIKSIKREHNWKINIEINFIDRTQIEGIIYDVMHGYVPYTGKKELILVENEYMELDSNSIDAIVCNVKAVELLKWFNDKREIKSYLQKNVRESLGDKSEINKGIRESFQKSPSLFWYKHNGIIIFVDSMELDKPNHKLILRNPQIVNGAQTVTQLFNEYSKNPIETNPTKILIRVYRLTYDDVSTYEKSIDIIAALNSQNEIKASDLHSTDPRQVLIENRIRELNNTFKKHNSFFEYNRKRHDDGRKFSSWFYMFMDRLAQIYYVAEYRKPHEGVTGGIQIYFEEKIKYNQAFPEEKIKKQLSGKYYHIAIDYITAWYTYHIIHRDLEKKITAVSKKEMIYYFKWHLLTDIHHKLIDWREKQFKEGPDNWLDFLVSDMFYQSILNFSKERFLYLYKNMVSKNIDDYTAYFKTTEASNKYLSLPTHTNEFNKFLNGAYEDYNDEYSE